MKQIIFKKKYNKNNKGFTIVEIAVAMTIFILILGVSTNIFISAVAQQRRILSEQQLVNQMSYVIEYMAKSLRMAIKDEANVCVKSEIYEPSEPEAGIYVLTRHNLATGYRGIRFLNASNTNDLEEPICQEFFLDDDNVLKEIKSSDSSADLFIGHAVPITSEKIEITSIKFAINGDSDKYYASNIDSAQPSVTIFLEAKIVGDNRPAKQIQTTISQRNLNTE